LIWQERLPVEVLAAAMALLAAPLIADLLVSLAGNLRRPRARHAASPRAIRLAVVVPAHNEETMLAGTVRSLLASGCVAAEAPLINEWRPRIFVVAHNCTDATSAVAAQAGARVIKLGDPGIRGKGAALRAGFRAALAAGANAFLVVAISLPPPARRWPRARRRRNAATNCNPRSPVRWARWRGCVCWLFEA